MALQCGVLAWATHNLILVVDISRIGCDCCIWIVGFEFVCACSWVEEVTIVIVGHLGDAQIVLLVFLATLIEAFFNLVNRVRLRHSRENSVVRRLMLRALMRHRVVRQMLSLQNLIVSGFAIR